MEFEQIIKRLEWLDKQQRENKDSLSALSERLNSFETSVNAVSKQIKTISKQVTEITPVTKRVDQYEAMLTKQRNDIIKMIEESDKKHTRTEGEIAKQHLPELLEINKSISQLKTTTTTSLTEFKKQLKERGDEMQRMRDNVSDFKTHVDEATRSNDDVVHALKAMDETRRNDLKHITDIQGELTSIRKRVDENREKHTMTADGLRNVESRFTDLISSELGRKQAQTAFLEQQAIAQIDRDRAWKEWKEKYEAFKKESANLDGHIQSLDEALRGAKRAQETYLELNTKLERRINEVTEMQRLAEDRLRQEWVSFKVDDQKRWTGYSLSNEESFRDIRKDLQKTDERITPLDDVTQVLQDQMHQVTDATEKELQEIMNVVHEWMTSYQRIMGHGKKTTK
jgi:DNA repair exonuclease SbcCD ATPase subunit